MFLLDLQKSNMTMIIERTEKEILIRIPNSIDIEGAQRIIDYIRYQVATAKSKAKQEDVDQLADEINRNWWEKNKDNFLK
jgi:predicted trehalose synthase